jgi:hypothetical protein
MKMPNETEPLIPTLSTQLSEREIFLIGSFVSQWGFLEADIFDQTLASFADSEVLPASMNNAQFSGVLQMWLERVVNEQDDAISAVLRAQHKEIVSLTEYRQAVVHSRWEWSPETPDEIAAVRIHKKSIKRLTLTADNLAHLCSRLGQVRYWIRYPRGLEDRAKEMSAAGGYISRVGSDLLSGRRSLDDLPTEGFRETAGS